MRQHRYNLSFANEKPYIGHFNCKTQIELHTYRMNLEIKK